MGVFWWKYGVLDCKYAVWCDIWQVWGGLGCFGVVWGVSIKMEKIQERALRFIYNDFQSSTEALLSLSDTSPLHIKRMKLMSCEAYKIINELSPTYIRDLINVKVSQYNFRNEHQDSQPQVNSSRYGLKSFRYEAARIWNSLPNNIRTTESFPHFKRLIRTWDGINCKCSSCSV